MLASEHSCSGSPQRDGIRKHAVLMRFLKNAITSTLRFNNMAFIVDPHKLSICLHWNRLQLKTETASLTEMVKTDKGKKKKYWSKV